MDALLLVKLFLLLLAFGLTIYGMVKNSAVFVGGGLLAALVDLLLIVVGVK